MAHGGSWFCALARSLEIFFDKVSVGISTKFSPSRGARPVIFDSITSGRIAHAVLRSLARRPIS